MMNEIQQAGKAVFSATPYRWHCDGYPFDRHVAIGKTIIQLIIN
jgi:hypothetical protein